MRSDSIIRSEGMMALTERLGFVEAERFITLVLREPFDYTEWQRDLYKNQSVDEIGRKAAAYWNAIHGEAREGAEKRNCLLTSISVKP